MADKKIAVLGGSFNPVHYGHIAVADNVASSGLVDEVWLSLSPLNPFKAGVLMPGPEERLEKLEKAIEGHPGLKVTDVELKLPVPSYAIDALRKLESENIHCSFVWLIGSDNLDAFVHWRQWQQILKDYGLLVYPRGTQPVILPEPLKQFSQYITLMADMPLYHISSTMIRNGLKS